MQLARNRAFCSSDRTAMRKVQEAYLAIQIERAFTKEQIFTPLTATRFTWAAEMVALKPHPEYGFFPNTPATSR